MPNIQVNITVTPSFDKVGQAFKLIKLGAALQRGVEKLAFNVERNSKIETPVDTGRLRSSINTSIGRLQARIAPHVVYAGWIHEGRMTRLGRTVHIQGRGRAGTPSGGRPFMKTGLDRSLQSANDITEQVRAEIEKQLRVI